MAVASLPHRLRILPANRKQMIIVGEEEAPVTSTAKMAVRLVLAARGSFAINRTMFNDTHSIKIHADGRRCFSGLAEAQKPVAAITRSICCKAAKISQTTVNDIRKGQRQQHGLIVMHYDIAKWEHGLSIRTTRADLIGIAINLISDRNAQAADLPDSSSRQRRYQ